MKFAKELEEDLVPEWKVKYFNYKQGKKRIKALQRSIQSAHKSPRTPIRRTLTPKTPFRDLWQFPPSNNQDGAKTIQPGIPQDDSGTGSPQTSVLRRHTASSESQAQPIPVPQPAHEQHSLTEGTSGDRRVSGSGTVWTRYGSIIGSPESPPLSRPATLTLPDPALDADPDDEPTESRGESNHSDRPIIGSAPETVGGPFEAGKTRHPSRLRRGLETRHLSLLNSNKVSMAARSTDRPLFRSIFSSSKLRSARRGIKYTDVPLEALKDIEVKQDEFFAFLDSEMNKIETFYKEKEEAATHRLKVLKEQLHVMRDQRIKEIEVERKARAERRASKHKKDDDIEDEESSNEDSGFRGLPSQLRNMSHNMDVIYHPIESAKKVRFGKTPQLNIMATPPDKAQNWNRDYTRRPEPTEISYLQAKRKLKAALQEYYRGLELLKSYALLNRTAFRKINKKYDKAVHARPTMRYMSGTVNNAWFVKSTVIDEYITATEDLYARYFEKGSHKVAVGKLRRKTRHAGAFTASVFRNGLTAAAGTVFGIQALVYAAQIYYSSEGTLAEQISYLLQIYAGYFLLLFLVLFFCVDCYVFTRSKINYVFIFEFDPRTNLDWRQLSELPCFFLFLMGFIMWLNFTFIGGDVMFLWWPVLLIGLSVVILFLPAPILYADARKWFICSIGRLLLAGGYPVEFRDFFLGDMFCSQTYSLGGIELFFCVYANAWMNPQQCNSSNSRILGFLMTLPGLARFLQCMRRYYDTRNIFPHLVNGGKYGFTIAQYATLSAFRLSPTDNLRAVFITFATINGIYTSIWDLVMDWSLMDPFAEWPLLRPNLAYKWPWAYYAAMILDPLLRFNWIFYAIPFFTDEIQHSTLIGFLVSFSEVIRRGIWTLFRVENEHCTNVGRFRASRDVPLPYDFPGSEGKASPTESADLASDVAGKGLGTNGPATASGSPSRAVLEPSVSQPSYVDPSVSVTPLSATGADLERAATHETAESSLRRRQKQGQPPAAMASPAPTMASRVASVLRTAHAQDFERRNKDGADDERARESEDDDDDDDDSDADAGGSDDEHAEGMLAAIQRGARGAANGAGPGESSWADGQGASGQTRAEEARRERAQDRETQMSNRSDLVEAETWVRRARGGETP